MLDFVCFCLCAGRKWSGVAFCKGRPAMKNFFKKIFCLLTVSFLLSSCLSFHKDNNHLTLADLLKHFKDKGVEIETVRPMRADTVKASNGAAVKIAGREIGIYKYNKGIRKQEQKLEWIIENDCVYIVGLKYPVKVNGSFVMIDFEKNPKKDKIIEAFESF